LKFEKVKETYCRHCVLFAQLGYHNIALQPAMTNSTFALLFYCICALTVRCWTQSVMSSYRWAERPCITTSAEGMKGRWNRIHSSATHTVKSRMLALLCAELKAHGLRTTTAGMQHYQTYTSITATWFYAQWCQRTSCVCFSVAIRLQLAAETIRREF